MWTSVVYHNEYVGFHKYALWIIILSSLRTDIGHCKVPDVCRDDSHTLTQSPIASTE